MKENNAKLEPKPTGFRTCTMCDSFGQVYSGYYERTGKTETSRYSGCQVYVERRIMVPCWICRGTKKVPIFKKEDRVKPQDCDYCSGHGLSNGKCSFATCPKCGAFSGTFPF